MVDMMVVKRVALSEMMKVEMTAGEMVGKMAYQTAA